LRGARGRDPLPGMPLRTLLPPLPRSGAGGPPLVLPELLDRGLERWWRLGPRVRAAVVVLLLLGLAATAVGRVARSPWGPPVTVAVATRDLPVGAPLQGAVVAARRPAALLAGDTVPPDAVPPEATLALGVVAGTVLTARHLRPGGPLADLAAGSAAVAVPTAALPGVTAGRRLDLVIARADGGGVVVAADARVLALDEGLAWVVVPRAAAADVAAAAGRGTLTAALLPD
jgi:hypothetical protein